MGKKKYEQIKAYRNKQEELVISRKERPKGPRATVLPKRLRTSQSALNLVRYGPLIPSENRCSKVTRKEAKMQWFKKGDKRLNKI